MPRQARIVLVNPPHSLEERYGAMKFAGNTMPSLSLLSLASVLQKSGFHVGFVDAPSRELDSARTLSEIRAFSPDAVGMTAFTSSVHNAARCAEEVKKALPGVPVVLGGPHVSAVPEETLRRFQAFDAAVVGEAETSAPVLFRSLLDGGSPETVAGAVYRVGGDVAVNQRPVAIANLDALPFPAWELAPGFPRIYRPAAHTYRRVPAATMFTIRGCPEQCSFCYHSIFGKQVRAFSAGYVVGHMEHLVRRFGIRELAIYDDTFPIIKPRVLEICDLMRRQGIRLSWSCLSRVRDADETVLRAMAAAGCHQIGYGIESGDQEILDRSGKRLTIAQIEQAVRMTVDSGIRVRGFFIMGHPGETPESLRRTVDLAKRLPLSDFQPALFTPFPGTDIRSRVGEYGTFDDDWRKMNCFSPVFIPKAFTRRQLVAAHARAYRQFYLRPRTILGYLFSIRRPEHVIQMIRGAAVIVKSWVIHR